MLPPSNQKQCNRNIQAGLFKRRALYHIWVVCVNTV